MASRIPLWDAPIRLFHWALVVLVVFSVVTAKVGGNWMEWHLRSGYCILTLLLFRLAWGFAGSPTARFSNFVRGPRAALEYSRALRSRMLPPVAGHNPLGGWMVLSMLAILLLQASSGLFADDEIATQGPLTGMVSSAVVERMSALHSWNQYLIFGTVALHLAAIAAYHWAFDVNLLGPMVHGGELPGNAAPRRGSIIVAAALLLAASALVYFLVIVLPRTS
jgi:cytochrome b